mmetsp:Transcript_14685/g.44122  ORF Transcript_14685/g.44122 Transcript_14685/m.44122 type:complete len:182 (+) Transcript_14685:103-648(+)|eukprot:CAMPEP_0118854552 /NCGR_PEP_ID=MMETSP1163-20130328/2719_1 /TAXON_ID=124430 /ORGANISM="Phaeomonas parva, Strain CCMP2877" /LENGTH=181 /DNA_ID=CAMNT_0006787293 /DNA_START=178 /DNA_END=723 /DNA_ORIENTATION=-
MVKAILILDQEGHRIAAKFFAPQFERNQPACQRVIDSLAGKVMPSTRTESDVLMVDDAIAIFRGGPDTLFFVLGDEDENEVFLAAVLDGLVDSLGSLLRGQIDRRTLLDNLALVLLTIDEICDSGVVLETDAGAIASRVLMRSPQGQLPAGEVPLSELTLSQAFVSARQQFLKSMAQQSFN